MRFNKNIKRNQKNKNKTPIIITSLILVLLIILGLIIYFEENDNDFKNENKSNTESITNSVINQIKDENIVSKINSNKEMVYDAEYLNSEDFNTSYIGKTSNIEYKIEDIIVPYININSEDVIDINNQIRNKYNQVVDNFKYEARGEKKSYDLMSYKVYVNGDILSVILIEKIGGTDVQKEQYYTYNINLKTLKKMSYKQMYESVGYLDTNINDKVKKCIASNEEFVNLSKDGQDINSYVLSSSNNYLKQVVDNQIQCFLDKTGKLNVIVTLNIPIGNGEKEEVIEIK